MSYKRHPWLINVSDRKCDPVTALRRRATNRRKALLAKPRVIRRGIEGAIDDLGEVIAARPEEVGALHAQATLLLNVKRNLEAKALLERATSNRPYPRQKFNRYVQRPRALEESRDGTQVWCRRGSHWHRNNPAAVQRRRRKFSTPGKVWPGAESVQQGIVFRPQ